MIRDILSHIDEYLLGQTSLRHLEAFVVANLSTILHSGDKGATELANQVDADLIELGERLLTESRLRERFELYLRLRETLTVQVPDTIRQSVTSTASTSETIFAESTITPVVDLRLGQVEFA